MLTRPMPGDLRLCAVSVDLDEIPNYHAIYGLEPPQPAAATAVYDRAIERLALFAEQRKIPLTLFAVGADVARPSNAQKLRAMVARGHEVANHSLDHLYDLSRLPALQILHQIDGGAQAIADATGRRPVGFRAPGYVINDEMMEALIATGHRYDSSVFPCPTYFAAKAAAMSWIGVTGRSSRSVQDHPRVLLAPRQPYRVGKPYHRRGDRPLIELPVQVTRGPMLPYIGTTLTLAGPRRARWLTKLVIGDPVICLELHGIDLLDRSDGLQALCSHTPDVRIAVATKIAALDAAIGMLQAAQYRFVRSEEAASIVASLRAES
jgi:peptidoglycan-N-acetylglucosamine deacetylase